MTDLLKVEPTCRYGHGPLFMIDHLRGEPVTYGMVVQGEGDQADSLFMNGMTWYLCRTCGYSEFFDLDVAQTLKNMGRPS